MDVTLERVQFKFASIIGELCSKPVILSQFAIWVDLRLAEYKLRGSISLDCSGDKPDPDWLKGMRSTDGFLEEYHREEHHNSPSRSRHAAQNISIGDSDEVSMTTVPHHQPVDITERLGPGVELRDTSTIVIKNDSDDDGQDVFPTGLHLHKSTNLNHSRKRSRENSSVDRGEDGLYSLMHSKVLKSVDSSMTTQSSNQSLMSIIGGQDSIHEASPVSLEDTQRDLDLAMAIQMQESQQMGDNSSAVTFIPARSSSHVTSTITKNNQEIDSSFNSPPNKSGISYSGGTCHNSSGACDVKPEQSQEGRKSFLLTEGEGVAFSVVQVKQEPVDHDVEYSWNTSSQDPSFACKAEPIQTDDTRFFRDDYVHVVENQTAPNSPASSWLQRMVKKENCPKVSPETKHYLGSASQTLLSLLEKGREPSAFAAQATKPVSDGVMRPSSVHGNNPAGMTLAALLTRTDKFTPGATSSVVSSSSRRPALSSNTGSPTPNTPVMDVTDSGGSENRGLTRLRRLLQGEDITVTPLEPFKKKCEDLESARAALKYFIARQVTDTPKEASQSDLRLKCIFCDYTRTIEDDSNFIIHVFAHSNNGELDHYNAICPRCTVSGLPSTEFVCHALSHCIISIRDTCP